MSANRLFLIALTFLGGCAEASGDPDGSTTELAADPIEGAWQLVESVRDSDQTLIGNRPGLRLFVDGHFSLVREAGTATRPRAPDSTGTVAALRAAWGPFDAQSGTYEIVGDTLVTRPVVEKNPALMEPGTFRRSTYRLSGDTLWVTIVANQAGPVLDPGTDKFVRVR